jgi:hypothetical protein
MFGAAAGRGAGARRHGPCMVNNPYYCGGKESFAKWRENSDLNDVCLSVDKFASKLNDCLYFGKFGLYLDVRST